MLLDPFEEQFDLPPAAIELSHGGSGCGHVVGHEYQPLAGVGIDISNAPESVRILLCGPRAGQEDRLVKADAEAFVHGRRVSPLEPEIGFGAGEKERRRPVDAVQPVEIDIGSVLT